MQPGLSLTGGPLGLLAAPGGPASNEYEFRVEFPIADALAFVWNTHEIQLSMGYTHVIGGNTYITSKTASEVVAGGDEPVDRIGSSFSYSVGSSGTIDTEFYSRNGAWAPDSFGSSFASLATGSSRPIYEGSSSAYGMARFNVFVWNRFSAAVPTQVGFLVNEATGADIDANGYDGDPASSFNTHSVDLTIFGVTVPAVFVSRSPTATLSGWSFTVTRTDWTY